MAIEAKITSKGQTTIPVEIRQRLGLRAGDRIAFIEQEHGFLIIPRNQPVDVLFGALAEYAIPDTSLEDYDAAIADGIASRADGKPRRRKAAA